LKKKFIDRRIQKTRIALHEALISLMQQKKYEWIAVQDILDQANVGRSTFYMHYRDKDELLIDGLNDLFETLRESQKAIPESAKKHERVIGFSSALFHHAYGHRKIFKMLVGGRGWDIFRNRMEEILMQLIKEEAKPLYKKRDNSFELLVYFLASSFLTVWNWWLSKKTPLQPDEIDSLFRQIVSPVLAANLT
jgi:AcrR family transcriptional regulator